MKGYIFKASKNQIRDAAITGLPRYRPMYLMVISGVQRFGLHGHKSRQRGFRGTFHFDFAKSRTNAGGKSFKQDFAESITKETVIKVFDRTPRSDVTSPTLGDESVDKGDSI